MEGEVGLALLFTGQKGVWGPFLEIPDNLPNPISIILNAFARITDVVLGQCFHRIVKILKFSIQSK